MRYFMHTDSGDVATLEDWRDDYERMDVESWTGKTAEEHDPDNWIEEGHLVEVEKDEYGDWEKV